MDSSSSGGGGNPWWPWQVSSGTQQGQAAAGGDDSSMSQEDAGTAGSKPGKVLCRVFKTRFLPHPSDAGRYYECVGVQFTERRSVI